MSKRLTHRTIFIFWLPLALSWLLMTFEGPWIQGVISRKPDAELQLAAFGLVFSLSVLIETPVIMLLATSSALARNRHAYRVLWRFMMLVNVFVTVIALLMAFTPLLDVYLGDLLGIPPDIIEATRPGMAIMVMWSAFIGYRRFRQGVLINHNHTAAVGRGSAVRIVVSAGVAFLLGWLTDLPGVQIGSWALISAVAIEALYIHFSSRADVAQVMDTPRPANKPELTTGGAARFHIPLALTSFMTLLVRPVIEAGLAGSDQAELALAAWPVVYSIMLMMRSGGMAWQEVVISLSAGPSQTRALRRFTWTLGLTLSGLMALMAFTPLLTFYIGTLLDAPESLHGLIATGAQLGIAIPVLTAVQSYLRALLMRSNTTNPIYLGMAIGFGVTAGGMWAGMNLLNLPGIPVAALALTAGMVIEVVFLWRVMTLNVRRLKFAWQV